MFVAIDHLHFVAQITQSNRRFELVVVLKMKISPGCTTPKGEIEDDVKSVAVTIIPSKWTGKMDAKMDVSSDQNIRHTDKERRDEISLPANETKTEKSPKR